MKHINLVNWTIFIFLFSGIHIQLNASTCQGFTDKEETSISVSVVSSNEFYEVNNLKLGFNVEMAQAKKTTGNYSTNEIVKLVQQLNPNSLRYPGGTPANYFNWYEEKLDERKVNDLANEHIKKLLNKLKNTNKGNLPVISIKSFAQLTDRFNIKPFVVLNVFLTNEDLKYSVDKVKNYIKSKVYWELGNEVSNEWYQKNIKLKDSRSWSIEQYRRKIKFIGGYIKSNYPDDEIGVVVSDMAKIRNPESVSTWLTEGKREYWDQKLMKSEKYFDAVIIHPYIFANNEVIDKVECGRSASYDEKYRTWIMSNASNLSGLYLQRLNKRFPLKKIWLTEFGIIDKNERLQSSWLEKQTGFRVLSSMANFISWIDKYPSVSALLFHGMFVGHNWAHIVYPDYSFTANGVAYYFVENFLNNIDEIAKENIDKPIFISAIDSYKKFNISTLSLLSGRNTLTGEKSMLLVNVSNHSIELTLPWEVKELISERFDWNEVIRPGRYKDYKDFLSILPNSKVINIAPRSISYIKSGVR